MHSQYKKESWYVYTAAFETVQYVTKFANVFMDYPQNTEFKLVEFLFDILVANVNP
jgi:hypothetical protein